MQGLSLEEAREILGEEGTGYTDSALLELIEHFEVIARQAVRNFEVLKAGDTPDLSVI